MTDARQFTDEEAMEAAEEAYREHKVVTKSDVALGDDFHWVVLGRTILSLKAQLEREKKLNSVLFSGNGALAGDCRKYLAKLTASEATCAKMQGLIEAIQWGGRSRCPMCTGWNVGDKGEHDMVHTSECPIAYALLDNRPTAAPEVVTETGGEE